MENFKDLTLESERLILKRINPPRDAPEIHQAISQTIDTLELWIPWVKKGMTVKVIILRHHFELCQLIIFLTLVRKVL